MANTLGVAPTIQRNQDLASAPVILFLFHPLFLTFCFLFFFRACFFLFSYFTNVNSENLMHAARAFTWNDAVVCE